MPEESYLEMVRAAVLAPSPDNNQPWRFSVREGRLHVYLDASRGMQSDVNCMFDLLAIGAAIENACISARHLNLHPLVQYCCPSLESDSTGLVPMATIAFEPGGQPDALYPQLETRCTCRRRYDPAPLPPERLDRLARQADGFPRTQLEWVADRRRIRQFSRLIARLDLIRFQYKPFHEEMYRQVRFTSNEAEKTRDGLDLRTLSLPPGGRLLLRVLRSWSRMQWVHRLGLGPMLAYPSALAVRKSGALGILSVPEAKTEALLDGGRALQRIWLAADGDGLAFQPLGSAPIYFGHVQRLGGKRISRDHKKRIERSIETFGRLVPETQSRVLVMVFRLGVAGRPKIRSLRRPPEEVFF